LERIVNLRKCAIEINSAILRNRDKGLIESIVASISEQAVDVRGVVIVVASALAVLLAKTLHDMGFFDAVGECAVRRADIVEDKRFRVWVSVDAVQPETAEREAAQCERCEDER
jgi:hypothetical protein